MSRLRLSTAAALRRFSLPGTSARWRRPPSLIAMKGTGASATAPALVFLFSAMVVIAIFSALKKVDKVKWAVAVLPSTSRGISPANQTNYSHQQNIERLKFAANRTERDQLVGPSQESSEKLAINSQSNYQATNQMNQTAIGIERLEFTRNGTDTGRDQLLGLSPQSARELNMHSISINLTAEIASRKQNDIERPGFDLPLKCTYDGNRTATTCPKNQYSPLTPEPEQSRGICPDYFRWIHEDLRPWRGSGITRGMVERARRTAHFRLVIIEGRVYVEKYRKSIQSRDLFTIWGILQLLRRYPGRVPDLELMFDCDDRPVVRSREYMGPNGTGPPPLFRYCGDKWTVDIVFPDWSFWGWPEIKIRPWDNLLEELKEGNGRTKWSEREPYAYWKGNPFVAETRMDLLKCNVSESADWNARLFIQDWIKESQEGYKNSDLPSQCTHRYKIYVEGYGWSVSEKYILACDSMTLLVKPHYYDFFTRSLEPLRHYWPVREDDKCRSIKFAVEWGNAHQREAQAIGRAAASFIQDQVKMDYVYDYMLHLLTEYAKLLKFVPEVPDGAEEICPESMGCSASNGPEREFMMESLVMDPSLNGPCDLPPPFEPKEFASLWRKKLSAIRRVERWEREYWDELLLEKNRTSIRG